MRWNALLLALAALTSLSLAGPPGNGGVVIAVRPASDVPDARVLIGDVADLSGGTTELRQQIASLDVAYLTATAATIELLRKQIAFRLRIAGIEPGRFRVEGPARFTVRRAKAVPDTHVVPATIRAEAGVRTADLIAVAQSRLLRRLPWRPEEVDVRCAQPVHLPKLALGPGDQVQLEATLSDSANLTGLVRINVAILVNGEQREQVPVFLDVRLYQAVAVTTRHIERSERLSADNLHCDRRPVEPAQNWPTYPECLADKRARRPLPPGQVVMRGDLEALSTDSPVLVHIRDAVKIVAHIGPMRISATGEALQDGRVGQMIRVRNLQTNKVVLGRVVDRSAIEVEY